MAEVIDIRPLYFTCVKCGTKQDAQLQVEFPPETPKVDRDGNPVMALYDSRVAKGSSEEHTCKKCGTRACYLWSEFTFDPKGAVIFVTEEEQVTLDG